MSGDWKVARDTSDVVRQLADRIQRGEVCNSTIMAHVFSETDAREYIIELRIPTRAVLMEAMRYDR